MPNDDLLNRITADPQIFGGKPIVRGRPSATKAAVTRVKAIRCMSFSLLAAATPKFSE